MLRSDPILLHNKIYHGRIDIRCLVEFPVVSDHADRVCEPANKRDRIIVKHFPHTLIHPRDIDQIVIQRYSAAVADALGAENFQVIIQSLCGLCVKTQKQQFMFRKALAELQGFLVQPGCFCMLRSYRRS